MKKLNTANIQLLLQEVDLVTHTILSWVNLILRVHIEPLTLFFDLIGLVFISWHLFSIPTSVKFVSNKEFGVITNIQDVEDAINKISRNFALIKKTRIGFFILFISLILKIINWTYY